MSDAPVPQPGIMELTPYKAFAKPKRPGRLIRLMANEGALGPSPRAVEAMGGRISIESTVDKGTCVSVWIPEVPPAAEGA